MNNVSIQKILVSLGLLDPPADGKWGELSRQALEIFQKTYGIPVTGQLTAETVAALTTVKTLEFKGDSLAPRICRYMQSKGYYISVGASRFNIVYLEGTDADGVPNDDTFDQWNDRRLIIEVVGGAVRIIGNWLATTEPGKYYTFNPMNEGGAFRISFGQYKAWKFGLHGRTQYPALVQCDTIVGTRDKNQDGLRTGDKVVSGSDIQVNQHHGWDEMPSIGKNSAGCLVGQSIEGHQTFLNVLRTDKRYLANPNYVFFTTIIDGSDLAKFK